MPVEDSATALELYVGLAASFWC